jgi:hypothetical protein
MSRQSALAALVCVDRRVASWVAVASLSLCQGCTSGIAQPLIAELDSSAAGSGKAGGGAGAGGSGTRAGVAGDPSFGFCTDGITEGASDREDRLLAELNDAIGRGDFCLDRPLGTSDDLRCYARAYARTLGPDTRRSDDGSRLPQAREGWTIIGPPTGDYWLWGKRHLVSVQDAKKALLDGKDEFCESPLHFTYKSAGIGQIGDTWAVLLFDNP